MWQRLLITLLLAMLAVAVYWWLHERHRRRATAVQDSHRDRDNGRSSLPQLLYFYGAHCAACSTQDRYLAQLAPRLNVTVEKINVDAEPETAARYGIFTLPSTLIIDGRGVVQQINYGLADPHKLARQLEKLQ